MTVAELIEELEQIEDKSVEVIVVMKDVYQRLHSDSIKDVWNLTDKAWVCNFTTDD